MEHEYEPLEYGRNIVEGLVVNIETDSDPESPREWDNVGTMVCWHRNYTLGDEQIHGGDIADHMIGLLGEVLSYEFTPTPRENLEKVIEELEEGEAGREELDAMLDKYYVMLPLMLYDHSGITMSTTRDRYPFNDQWDAGQVGFIYASKKKLHEEGIEDGEAALRGEVATYDQYLTGAVYGYSIEDEDGEHLDSCWGFYGEDYVIESASEALNACLDERHRDHMDDVKTWIRNKVPLHIRQELSMAH